MSVSSSAVCDAWDIIHKVNDAENGTGGFEEDNTINIPRLLCRAKELRLLVDSVAVTTLQKLYLLIWVVNSLFETSEPEEIGYINFDVWKYCVEDVLRITDVLKEDPEIELCPSMDFLKLTKNKLYVEGRDYVYGDFAEYVDDLAYSFFWNLKSVEPNSEEYVERVKYETKLMVVCQQVLRYLLRKIKWGRKEIRKQAARVASVLLGLVSYKPEEVYNKMRRENEEIETNDEHKLMVPDKSRTWIDLLIKVVNNYGNDVVKTRARVCDLYHRAMSDELLEASKMLAMIRPCVGQMSAADNVRFNGALAQYGLCAFRAGSIEEAWSCLSEMVDGGGRFNANLGQEDGVFGPPWGTYEDYVRGNAQLPSHMHIDVELVKNVHMVLLRGKGRDEDPI